MKTKLRFVMILAVLCAVAGATPAWAQLATISGKVTDNDKPLAGVQVIYKGTNTGRVVKAKTNSNGEFSSIGVTIDVYDVSVVDASGKTIFTHEKLPVGVGGDDANNILNIDITKGATAKTPVGAAVGNAVAGRTQEFAGAGGKEASGGSKSSTSGPKMSKEEREKLEAENAKARNINALIEQAQKAMNEKNWKDAEPILKQMVAAEPNRWEFYQALGNAQVSMGDYYQSLASGKAKPPENDQHKPEEYAELSQKEYEDGIASYQKGVEVAQSVVSGTLPKDPKNPSTDPVKAKAGMGQMLGGQGNAYIKVGQGNASIRVEKNKEAVEAFTKAAEMDPNPAIAYFNLCATQYNTGNTDGALAACDKAIAADPNKADAYYIKGSLMVGQGTMDKDNKVKVPAGTEEALKKYLALAPDGPHAADVKQMLEFIGSKVETTYKTRKK